MMRAIGLGRGGYNVIPMKRLEQLREKCFCLSLCYVWFAAITYVVDLAQAQERVEFLRKKYCALLKEKEQ